MVFDGPKRPLRLEEIPIPLPKKGQIQIEVHACAVCRTDLHIVAGELEHPKLPLILGHQIVGTIKALGDGVNEFKIGDRVGVPWMGGSCSECEYCLSGQENLCDNAIFTGYEINGGFAEYAVANAAYCFQIPKNYPDLQAAPLLCGGLIGYRSYKMAGKGKKMGFYGFGNAAHILIQVAVYEGREVYAFTRKEDREAQSYAIKLGAAWAGSSEELSPEMLDSAIIFAPVGSLVPEALKSVKKGGKVVCAGIHMSDIPSFPYSLMYGERSITSVTNLTRQDGTEFLELAPKIPIKTFITAYPLEKTNEALEDLKTGKITGAAVIEISKNK